MNPLVMHMKIHRINCKAIGSEILSITVQNCNKNFTKKFIAKNTHTNQCVIKKSSPIQK